MDILIFHVIWYDKLTGDSALYPILAYMWRTSNKFVNTTYTKETE